MNAAGIECPIGPAERRTKHPGRTIKVMVETAARVWTAVLQAARRPCWAQPTKIAPTGTAGTGSLTILPIVARPSLDITATNIPGAGDLGISEWGTTQYKSKNDGGD